MMEDTSHRYAPTSKLVETEIVDIASIGRVTGMSAQKLDEQHVHVAFTGNTYLLNAFLSPAQVRELRDLLDECL